MSISLFTVYTNMLLKVVLFKMQHSHIVEEQVVFSWSLQAMKVDMKNTSRILRRLKTTQLLSKRVHLRW